MTIARYKEASWLTRERGQALAFVAIGGAVAWLCWLVTEPMVGPITWGLALAVLALPLHQWLARKLKRENVAAGLTTLVVAILLVVPATLAVRQLGQEAVGAASKVQASIKDGSWSRRIEGNPRFKAASGWLSGMLDPQEQLEKLSE